MVLLKKKQKNTYKNVDKVGGMKMIDIKQVTLDCIEKNRKRAEGTGDKL